MASGDVETAKTSSAPSNPDVNPTMSMLLKGLQWQYGSGVKVFGKSLYPGVSGATQDAWKRGTSDASGLLASGGFSAPQTSAMSSLSGLQSGYADLGGAYDQNAPGYSALRQNLMDDAVKNVGAGFNAAGRFGGGSYINDATKSAVNAVAPLDYQNFQNDIANRYRSLDSQAGIGSTLFGMGQQGIANRGTAIGQLGALGAAQDADMLARRQGENDLFRRTNDAGWDALAKGSAILGGTAPFGGTDTTKSVPWWAALGGGLGTLFGMM